MKARIKVLFTIPNFITAGSGKHLHDLIQHLSKDIIEPVVAVKSPGGHYYDELINSGIEIVEIDFDPPFTKSLMTLARCRKLSQQFKEHRVDLIHSFHYASILSEPVAARISDIPWIFTKKNMSWNAQWKWKHRLSKATVVVNPEMEAYFDLKAQKTHFIPLGVDIPLIEKELRKTNVQEVREELGIPKGRLVIGSVANLVKLKNIDLILKAAHKLQERYDLHVLVVGDDKNETGENLKGLTSELKMEQRVSFTGKVTNVERYLKVIDVYLQPSDREGLCISVIEAIFSDTPVLVSDIQGLRFQVDHQKEYLFQKGELAPMVEKLEHILSLSPEERKQIAQKQRSAAGQRFELNAIAKKHEELYVEILGF